MLRRWLFVLIAVVVSYSALFLIAVIFWLPFEHFRIVVLPQLMYEAPDRVTPILPFFGLLQPWVVYLIWLGWLGSVYFVTRFIWRRWPRLPSRTSA